MHFLHIARPSVERLAGFLFARYVRAMFRLPEITYPLCIDTVGKTLAMGEEYTVHCNNHGCHHSGRVNLVAFATKHGMDHTNGATALRRFFHCSKCRAKGKSDKNISFICSAAGKASDWPRKVAEHYFLR